MAQPVGPQPGNNAPSKEPWRSGRPSFKAFYPELVLLTIATIAFVALGAKLSCNVLKKEKEKNAPPEVVALVPMDSNAYAQAPIDAVKYSQESIKVPEETAPAEPVDVSEPVETSAPVETPETTETAETTENAEETATPVEPQEPVESVKPATSVPSTSAPTSQPGVPVAQLSSAPTGLVVATRLTMIWIWCLIVPAALWIWRGWVWIATIYGVRYELRVDVDNPRATTFLITRGIFNHTTDSLHIGQVKDIQNRQSFWQKYLMGGVGTIVLFTSDLTDPEVYMKNMAEPGRVFNAFDDMRRHFWGRGGVPVGLGDGGSGDGDA